MNRIRLLGVAFMTVAIMATGVASASAAGLTGAGSSLVAPLMANWINGFEIREGIPVKYGSVGSGAGIAQITARTVDFGASDAPLTPEQAGACGGCVQIPWALTGVGIGFHIPGVKKLNLSGSILAGIYFGKITKWNDAKIKKLNPKAHLPGMKITPVFRSDGSGDTYAFTDYLSKVSGAWKKKVGSATSVQFPSGVGGKGNSGVTSTVTSTNGSIGYISASYLVAAGLGAAAVQNKAGKFELPEPEQHRGGRVGRQEGSGQQQDQHHEPTEEGEDRLPDLDLLSNQDEIADATRRTRLANERTELAWWRTGLTALAVALGIGRVVPELNGSGVRWPYVVAGVGFALWGIAAIAYGSRRSAEVERVLAVGRFPSRPAGRVPPWRSAAWRSAC